MAPAPIRPSMLRGDGLETLTLGKSIPSSGNHPEPLPQASGTRFTRTVAETLQDTSSRFMGRWLAAGLRKVGGTVGCSRLSATFTQDRSCNGCRLKKRWRCKDLADGTVVAPAISSHPVS